MDAIPCLCLRMALMVNLWTSVCFLVECSLESGRLFAAYVPERISLLQRGWVIAFCHVRGGGEGGVAWHNSGRLERKQNSIRDLEVCLLLPQHRPLHTEKLLEFFFV